MGIQRIGSDMAECAGLISAAMWRLSINHQIPTVICTDSDTGGKQAFGGVQTPDESYKLMRSLYQALELGLPHGALTLHHTRSHTDDLFNEIADMAAKREAEKSLNLPRQQLDLRRWRAKLSTLWTMFSHKLVCQHGDMVSLTLRRQSSLFNENPTMQKIRAQNQNIVNLNTMQ